MAAPPSPGPSPLGSPSSTRSSLHLAPPPYSPYPGKFSSSTWYDPRTSSTQSLVPSMSSEPDGGGEDRRRTLLVIYIHGYNGNSRSFKSFPAHIHHYLKDALAASHKIHSKIYPRYKTYRAIEVGVENFSEWLSVMESEETDVVLVGHSMGGILAAEVVLMPNTNPYSRYPYKHRILGVVALDTPYLGLHPGIISAGIASLFRANPEEPKASEEASSPAPQATSSIPDFQPQSQSPRPSMSTSQSAQTTDTELFSSQGSSLTALTSPSQTHVPTSDPLFDPRWENDTVYKERPFFKGLAHFTKKHFSEGVFNAAAKHILSHMEYANTLVDYPGLNTRYSNLRALEDVDDLKELGNPEQISGPSFRPNPGRVRFVNYYTISTGFPKKSKSTPTSASPYLKPEDAAEVSPESQISTPRISVEDPNGATGPAALEAINSDSFDNIDIKDPVEEEPCEEQPSLSSPPSPSPPPAATPALAPEEDPDAGLPAIPPMPTPPQPLNTEQYPDKDTRKQAEKEHKRLQKTYDQALKDRAKAIKERAKISEKRRRKAAKEAERREKEALKAQLRQEGVNADVNSNGNGNGNGSTSKLPEEPKQDDGNRSRERQVGKERDKENAKPKKERKFCSTPKKGNGERDKTWVSIFMKEVDEVGAHCGLFVPGEHYDKLVGDVGERIVGWVQEDLSRREILRMMEAQAS